ncbi:Fasciclin domain-containing protein [Pedobacter suwonensis]|uniref:Fasciclin domain-containing protein n=2 Tax=Sphingobacteriaceae TaxID=84566 RepID=A0A1I0T9U0_9SPHI|nr:Fasciclin domain-containing protein [Pedobacter suwonensis]
MVVINYNKRHMKKLIFACAALLLVLNACKRDEYYRDGGLANPNFNGNMLQYLQAKKVPFDTIAQIVKLAGMESTFSNEDFTFFAPDDEVIKKTIGTVKTGGLNNFLFYSGKDTVKTLDQISPVIWKRYLQRYMFKGVNKLKDYQQIDFDVKSVYPGGLYYSLGGNISNIGVTYGTANNIKYIGYRQLNLTYIPDASKPNDNWYINKVASSDIKPTNGVVHTLAYNETRGGAYFGFNERDFFSDVYYSGLTPSDSSK